MKLNALLIALLSATVALAGCTDGDEVDTDSVDTEIDPDTFRLGNKGGIQGLIVDDNYRPVQLKEDWGNQPPGDYQDVGFVIILETAQRFETTENGEFVVAPLEPGTYTIRVAADDHEAIDRQVKVVSGEFAEVTVEARRTFSSGGTVVSQEYVVFAGCSAEVLVNAIANLPCGDFSGDSLRAAFTTDYIEYKNDIRGMVVEMRAEQDGGYAVQMRNSDAPNCTNYRNWCLYWYGQTAVDERYSKGVVYPDKAWQRDGVSYLEEGQEGYCTVDDVANNTAGCNDTFPPDFKLPMDTIIFPRHPSREYTLPLGATFNGISPVDLNWYGVGPVLGVKAQFLHTVFLYELPEEGIQDYCALCEDADIPE